MAKDTEKDAVDWYIGKARSASGYRRNMFENSPNRERSGTIQGKMYFFSYDPKHKTRLPMYDRFPLVFPIDPKPGGFLGLNLHYLSADERSALLGNMIRFANNKKMDKTTKLNVTYDLVKNIRSISSLARPCVKHYLYGHVRSPFIEITADEWDKVVALPLELFVYKR